jgi:hypothetical protein
MTSSELAVPVSDTDATAILILLTTVGMLDNLLQNKVFAYKF